MFWCVAKAKFNISFFEGVSVMYRNLLYLIFCVFVLCLGSANITEAQDDPNLIGWWKLDEISGTIAADSSGYGNDGTVVGGSQWVSGYIDGALDFDGDDDYVDCGYNPIFDTANEMTLAAWVTIRSIPTAWSCVIAKGEYSWRISSENLETRFHFGITIWSASNPSIPGDTAVGLDEWHHVAGTYDGENINVYLDGTLDGTVATTSPIGVNAANVLIGENPEAAGRNWDGLIDDVRIYNRALSPAEIGELMPTQLKATAPLPYDKSILSVTDIELSWIPGQTAAGHHLYLGENAEDVANGTGDTDMGSLSIGVYQGQDFEIGNTYYWRVAETASDGTVLHPGDVWSFTILPLTASKPIPDDGAEYVSPDVLLRWTAGAGATRHHVYFNTNQALVSGRAAAADKGNVEDPNFSPGQLDYNTEYFWMVDEYDGTTTHQGSVWSFTTVGPNNGVKAEYFNNTDLTGDPVLVRTDPKIDFVWGGESPDPLVNTDGFSARWTGEIEVPVSDTYTFYSISDDNARLWVDGQLLVDNWNSDNAWAFEDEGSIYLDAGWASLVMEFFDEAGDAIAQLKWQSSTIPRQIVSPAVLSKPLRATAPDPANGETDSESSLILEWIKGDEAAQHDVYFGTDYNDVAQADVITSGIYKGRQDRDNTQYTPAEGLLEWNTTYYWRIDEVNENNPETILKGKVWRFTTGDFVIIDDFEAYNDINEGEEDCNRIYLVWSDGYANPNVNGSTIGYPAPNFANGEHFVETDIIHGGDQSGPLLYNNTTASYSEVSLSTSQMAIGQDWTQKGLNTLSMWFYGDPNNAGTEQLYVKLNNSKLVISGVDLTLTQWQNVEIPLADFGIGLTNVTQIVIGLERTGAGSEGILFMDDLRLRYIE
jgi:hypothetical protein